MSIKGSKPESKHAVLDWALAYAARGWRVLPIYPVDKTGKCTCSRPECPERDQGKHPKTPNGLSDASSKEATVREWFTKPKKAAKGWIAPNIAIATGRESGITVIDVDMGDGKVGEVTWAALIEGHGEPVTLMANTGGGGIHALFQYTDDLKTGNDRLGLNVDVKNDGGYILACPSNHRSGGRYQWDDDTVPMAVLPEYLKEKNETRGPKKNDPRRRTYGLSDVASMLEVISADNRTLWINVGVILGRTFNRSDEAWALYHKWADKYEGERNATHEKTMWTAFYETSQITKEKALTIGTIVHEAMEAGWVPTTGRIPVDALYFHVGHGYLYRPTMDTWDEKNTDLAVSPVKHDGITMKATQYLQRCRMVTCVTSHPALEEYTPEVNVVKGELVEDHGAATLNVFRHPTIVPGDPALAQPWVDHCRLVFNKPGDADQFFNYLAHRRQHPGVKPRFALLIGGEQGTGKDTAVEFCVPAMGAWNVESIGPARLQSQFNDFLACTLLRVNEAADARDQSRWMLNEQLKVIIGGVPDHAALNGKYQLTQHIRLYCGVIVTTNSLMSSVFIPEDDRRFDVIEANTLAGMGLKATDEKRAAATDLEALEKFYEKGKADYFNELWEWFLADQNAVAAHIAAWLDARDISKWSPDLGQRKTAAHRSVIRCGMIGDEWAADALALCTNTNMVSGRLLTQNAVKAGEREGDVKGRLSHSMSRLGYDLYPNPMAKDGRWKIEGLPTRIFRLRTFVPEENWETTLDPLPERF